MAVDIAEKKATLEVSYTDCEDTIFDFELPISEDYEVDFSISENIQLREEQFDDDHSNAAIKLRYSQGALYIHTECGEEQGFELEVKDAEHTYNSVGWGTWNNRNDLQEHNKGIEVTIDQDDHYDELEGQEK
jgi:hypothetical protein